MTLNLAILSALELPEPGSEALVPDWIHLVPKGTFQARDGRGPWRYTNADALIRRSFASRKKLHIDVNHSTDSAAKNGLSAPAIGYIQQMEERENGIWAEIKWTKSGEELLSDRAYWGVSPVIEYDTSGEVIAIARAALTNDPSVSDLTPLSTQETDTMFLSKVAKLLGLADDTAEDAVLAALSTKLKADPDTAALSAIGTALGVVGTPDLTTLVTTANVLKSASGEQAQTLAALQAQVATLTENGAKSQAQAFVDKAVQDGHAIPSPIQVELVALHTTNPEMAAKLVVSYPKIGTTHTTQPSPDAARLNTAALSTEQAHAASLLGIPAEDYLKTLNDEKGAN